MAPVRAQRCRLSQLAPICMPPLQRHADIAHPDDAHPQHGPMPVTTPRSAIPSSSCIWPRPLAVPSPCARATRTRMLIVAGPNRRNSTIRQDGRAQAPVASVRLAAQQLPIRTSRRLNAGVTGRRFVGVDAIRSIYLGTPQKCRLHCAASATDQGPDANGICPGCVTGGRANREWRHRCADSHRQPSALKSHFMAPKEERPCKEPSRGQCRHAGPLT